MDSLEKLQKFEKRVSSEIVALHQALKTVTDKLAQLNHGHSEHCSHKSVEAIRDVCDTRNASYRIALQDVRSDLINALSQIVDLYKEVNELKAQILDIRKELLSLGALFITRIKEMEKVQLRLFDAFYDGQNALRKEFLDRIDNLDIPCHIDVDGLEAHIKQICQTAIDESRAAHNKSITNQSRIHILEKKLAHLQGDL